MLFGNWKLSVPILIVLWDFLIDSKFHLLKNKHPLIVFFEEWLIVACIRGSISMFQIWSIHSKLGWMLQCCRRLNWTVNDLQKSAEMVVKGLQVVRHNVPISDGKRRRLEWCGVRWSGRLWPLWFFFSPTTKILPSNHFKNSSSIQLPHQSVRVSGAAYPPSFKLQWISNFIIIISSGSCYSVHPHSHQGASLLHDFLSQGMRSRDCRCEGLITLEHLIIVIIGCVNYLLASPEIDFILAYSCNLYERLLIFEVSLWIHVDCGRCSYSRMVECW